MNEEDQREYDNQRAEILEDDEIFREIEAAGEKAQHTGKGKDLIDYLNLRRTARS